jgi:hypothetical protein
MRLLELTPTEIAFLTAPAAASDDLQGRLTRKLAATLTARLRLPVQVTAMPPAEPAAAPADATATSAWQPDAALANLWLTRRLGGQRVMGATSLIPSTLIHTLDAALAESWLDGAAQAAACAGVANHSSAHAGNAGRAVAAPHNRHDALGARSDTAWLSMLRQARCC